MTHEWAGRFGLVGLILGVMTYGATFGAGLAASHARQVCDPRRIETFGLCQQIEPATQVFYIMIASAMVPIAAVVGGIAWSLRHRSVLFCD